MRWLAFLLLLAPPAQATQDAWPALFDVAGVAADDVLNLRAEPDAAAEIVGTLQPDQVDIEVIRPNDREIWGLVNVPEGTGWVSLRFLTRQPGQWQGAFPRIAACFGTEPFWTLTLRPDVSLRSPEADVAGAVTARLESANRLDRWGISVDLDGEALHGIVSSRACSDGMSDGEWGLALDAIHGGGVLSGCCTLAR